MQSDLEVEIDEVEVEVRTREERNEGHAARQSTCVRTKGRPVEESGYKEQRW